MGHVTREDRGEDDLAAGGLFARLGLAGEPERAAYRFGPQKYGAAAPMQGKRMVFITFTNRTTEAREGRGDAGLEAAFRRDQQGWQHV